MNVAIITGASSGIGRETARQLDSIYTDGIDELWLIARRKERMEELAGELIHKCHILSLDLLNSNSFEVLKSELELVKPNVKMLVNASGYGVNGNFDETDLNAQLGMINLNCLALTHITGLVLPYMSKGGRIIQIASSAAFIPQIGFSVYAASKAYVLSFSESLNTELKERKISVTAVCPGPVDTEFFEHFEKGQLFDFKKYFMANEKDVVRQALRDSYNRKAVSIYSLPMKAFKMLTDSVPDNVMLYAMDKLKSIGGNKEQSEK